MAKVYALHPTAIVHGMARSNSYLSNTWNNLFNFNPTELKAGMAGAWVEMYHFPGSYMWNEMHCLNLMFDQTELAALRAKTVTAVSLSVKVSGTLKANNNDNRHQVRFKLDPGSGAGTASGEGTTVAGRIQSSTSSDQTVSNQVVSASLSTSIPKYGYVVGPASFTSYGAYGLLTFSSDLNDTTLYVTTNETDYELSFNANGGTGAPAKLTGTGIGSYAFTIPNTTPTRSGYTFLGWSASQTASSASYQPGGTYTATDSVTLYAVWQLITYAVTFNANGGTNAPAAQTKQHNVALTLTTAKPTRTGYLFQGWATSASGAVAYQSGGSYTANAAITLYAVWKAANSTLNSVTTPVTIGVTNGGTAAWNVIDSAYTYKLVLTCGNAPAVTVNVAANTASTTFTIPNTWLSYLASAVTATATATLTTYSGSTALGTSSRTFTVSVASSVKPTISSFAASHYSSNATVSGWGVYTQGYSQVDLSVSASAGSGASISSIAFSGPGISQSGASASGRTAVLDSPGAKSYTVTVTDSRGRSASATVSVTVQPYARPVITGIETNRAKADGTIDNGNGGYLAAKPTYSISSVSGKNSITSQVLRYREHGTSTWAASKTCANGATLKPPGTMWSVSTVKSYDVSVVVTDAMGNTTELIIVIPGASGLWYGPDNDCLGLGAPPDGPGFYCTWDAHFKGGFAIGSTGLTEAQLQALKALIS